MKNSLSNRIAKAIFFTCSLLVILYSLSTIYIAEGWQKSLYFDEYLDERTFLLERLGSSHSFEHVTKNDFMEFIAKGDTSNAPDSPLFHGTSIGEYELENIDGREYWIIVDKIPEGTFYHSRDITETEERERQYFITLVCMAISFVILNYILSKHLSKRIIAPLKLLSESVRSRTVGKSIVRINEEYEDRETHQISKAFNSHLSEIEKYVTREKSLLSLASHELKTPISVILGTAEVLSKTCVSNDVDKLDRIRKAATEMNDNVSTLLRLSRGEHNQVNISSFRIDELVDEVVLDLASTFCTKERVLVYSENVVHVDTDRTLVKMLVRNLIQNSLQHSSSNISIYIERSSIKLADRGKSLPPELTKSIASNSPEITLNKSNGLGLYIVSLICERLSWIVDYSYNDLEGKTIHISWDLASF